MCWVLRWALIITGFLCTVYFIMCEISRLQSAINSFQTASNAARFQLLRTKVFLFSNESIVFLLCVAILFCETPSDVYFCLFFSIRVCFVLHFYILYPLFFCYQHIYWCYFVHIGFNTRVIAYGLLTDVTCRRRVKFVAYKSVLYSSIDVHCWNK